MSSSMEFIVVAPVALVAAPTLVVAGDVFIAAAGSALVAAANVTASVVSAAGQAALTAANHMAGVMEDLEERFNHHLLTQLLTVRPGLEAEFAAALLEHGFRPHPQERGSVQWMDHERRVHEVAEVWVGHVGVIGFSRTENGAIAFVRSEEAKQALAKVSATYVQRVLGRFPVSAPSTMRIAGTVAYDLPSGEGETLPVVTKYKAGKLEAEVMNPALDECCVQPANELTQLFGKPERHTSKVMYRGRKRAKNVPEQGVVIPGIVPVSSSVQAKPTVKTTSGAPLSSPQKIKIRQGS